MQLCSGRSSIALRDNNAHSLLVCTRGLFESQLRCARHWLLAVLTPQPFPNQFLAESFWPKTTVILMFQFTTAAYAQIYFINSIENCRDFFAHVSFITILIIRHSLSTSIKRQSVASAVWCYIFSEILLHTLHIPFLIYPVLSYSHIPLKKVGRPVVIHALPEILDMIDFDLPSEP